MDDLIVIARDVQLGDALMCAPAIEGLAQRHPRLFLAMANREIQALLDLPPNVIDVLDAEPPFRRRELPVQVLGVAAAIGYRFEPDMMATINCVMAYAGLPVHPPDVPRPKIKIAPMWEQMAPSYDIVLAPWTTAPERTMTVEQVEELLAKLKDCTVAIAGGRHDPRFTKLVGYEDLLGQKPRAYCYGEDFGFLAAIMQRAKVVVAVDSFPGRLAHAANVKHHIVLDSLATPIQTQTYPGAIAVHGTRPRYDLVQWDLDQIVSAIEGCL